MEGPSALDAVIDAGNRGRWPELGLRRAVGAVPAGRFRAQIDPRLVCNHPSGVAAQLYRLSPTPEQKARSSSRYAAVP